MRLIFYGQDKKTIFHSFFIIIGTFYNSNFLLLFSNGCVLRFVSIVDLIRKVLLVLCSAFVFLQHSALSEFLYPFSNIEIRFQIAFSHFPFNAGKTSKHKQALLYIA